METQVQAKRRVQRRCYRRSACSRFASPPLALPCFRLRRCVSHVCGVSCVLCPRCGTLCSLGRTRVVLMYCIGPGAGRAVCPSSATRPATVLGSLQAVKKRCGPYSSLAHGGIYGVGSPTRRFVTYKLYDETIGYDLHCSVHVGSYKLDLQKRTVLGKFGVKFAVGVHATREHGPH